MEIGRVDPELRDEVRAYARIWRWSGLGLVIVAALCIIWPRISGEWPMLGNFALQDVGFVLLALAWVILIGVIVKRSRFYRRRLTELGKR